VAKALCLKQRWSDFGPKAYIPHDGDQKVEIPPLGLDNKGFRAAVDS
jgi:hypothetical protein